MTINKSFIELKSYLTDFMLLNGVSKSEVDRYLAEITEVELALIQDVLLEMQQYGYSKTYQELRGIQWKWEPVDPYTFLTDDYYMGAMGRALYPKLQEHFIDIYTLNKFVEIILTGGIGYGKDYLSVIIGCYEFYKLSCLKNPHMYLGLAPNTPIVGAILNVTTSKSSEYFENFKAAIDTIEYFKENFQRSLRKNSILEFPSRIVFKDAGSTTLGAIGCLSGETRVVLNSGAEETFENLEKHYKDKEFEVVSYDLQNKKEVKGVASNPHISKYVEDLIEIELENGKMIRSTPEHLFLLVDGTYKQAQNLTENDELQECVILY